MPYIGQRPATGEANSFKILDEISSYTLTFDGSSAGVVSLANDTITEREHRFVTGQRVTYNDGGGTAITGLSDGVYYIIVEDRHTFKLASSANNAASGTAINLTALGVGASHTLNVAFDGVNTKFKATIDNGDRAGITRSGQLMLSINGVLQEPHDNTDSPTTGYATDHTSTIIFSAAPAATDQFFGRLIASNFATFDISDNVVDNFTGDGSTSTFTLSKSPANNESVLVTIDGVVQYPDDNAATRAYSVSENTITFASAPGSAVEIQVRHIGFAGAQSAGITGFYGRTGNAVLKSTDDIVFNDATASGTVQAANVTVTGDLTVNGTTTTLDTDLIGVDKLEVAANNTTVAAAITQTGTGDILNLYDAGSAILSVKDGGNIIMGAGAGSVTPHAPLHVRTGTTGAITTLLKLHGPFTSNTGSEGTAIDFGTASDTSVGARIIGTREAAGAKGALRFCTGRENDSGFNDGHVVIDETGKVGIGLTNPDWNLDIKSTNVNTVVRLKSSGSTNGGQLQVNSDDLILRNRDAGELQLWTNDSNKLTITSSGKVGINETTPEAKLEVDGRIRVLDNNDATPSTGKGLEISYFNTADYADILSYDRGGSAYKDLYLRGNNLVFKTGTSERLRITSGGKLLAGHTASRDVFRETRVQISGASGDDAGLSIYSTEDGIAGPNLILGHSRNGDAVNSGDVLGDITFVGHDSNNLNSRASIIRSIMTANGTINSLYADLTFYTKRNSNGYPDESLRITSAGKVGINAANPNSLLEVRGTAGTYTNGITVFTGNTTHSGSNAKNGVGLYSFGDALKGGLSSNLLYSNSSTPSQSYATRSSGKIEISNTTTSNQTSLITFGGYYKGTTTFVERLRISSDGKIGINNSAPLYAMHFKNAMGSSPSFIHMEVTGTNTVGGGGGIAFDTSASNAQSNNGLYLATISGIRNSSDDGSNDLVFKTTRAGAPGDDGNDNSPKERLRIDSSGNAKFISNARQIILRNDGSSGQPKIDFRNAADSGDAFAFINGATLDLQTGGTTRFHITSNGSIATGGLLPTDGSFCVNSTIRSQNSSSNISYIGFTQYTSNTSVGGMFSYIGGDGRNTGYLTFNTNDTERLRITSGGDTEIRNIVSGITNSYSQYLKFRTTQTNGQSAVTGQIAAQGKSSWGGALVFYTKPANGSPNDTVTERLRIDQNGGIIKGSTNSSSSSQVIQMFFNKRGTCKGKRVHQGSGSGSTTHSLLTINSWQSSNTRVFCYVTVHYVNPVANLGGRMETYAAANYGGTRNTGTFAVADGGRWGSPNGTMSLSWNGNTLQLNTFNNAYMEYSVDITYVAYDGASITFATN